MTANGVSIVGFFRVELGISQAARRASASMEAIQHPVFRHDIPTRAGVFEESLDEQHLTPGFPATPDVVLYLNPPDLIHVVPRFVRRSQSIRRLIGFWHWELPLFPREWSGSLDLVDEIWTPSRFGNDIFSAATSKPVRTVPHAVPANDIPSQQAREQLGLPPDRFLFLGICDTSSFPRRKNPGGAVRAFLDAFPDRSAESPLLLLKLHGKRNRERGLADLYARIGDHPNIRVLDQVFDESRMRQLQAACDCFVSLHRSECFGLNIAECMAAGRLVIVTDFSGSMDFANAGNAVLIPYERRDVLAGEYPHHAGQWWAEPDHEAAVEAMRWAVRETSAVARLAESARESVRRTLSFESVGGTILRTLQSSA